MGFNPRPPSLTGEPANGGGWQLEGGETPAGETSPLLYAGGLVQLGATALS